MKKYIKKINSKGEVEIIEQSLVRVMKPSEYNLFVLRNKKYGLKPITNRKILNHEKK